MDEFGETTAIYIWPKGHEAGEPLPEDWYDRYSKALRDAGIEWETV